MLSYFVLGSQWNGFREMHQSTILSYCKHLYETRYDIPLKVDFIIPALTMDMFALPAIPAAESWTLLSVPSAVRMAV